MDETKRFEEFLNQWYKYIQMFEIKIRGEKKETELIKIVVRVFANSAR